MALATAAESCAGVIAGADIAGAAASVVIWTKVASDSAPGRAIVAASRSSLISVTLHCPCASQGCSLVAICEADCRRGATGRQAARRCGRARDNKAVTSSPFEAT
jgi:hypothetical protein